MTITKSSATMAAVPIFCPPKLLLETSIPDTSPTGLSPLPLNGMIRSPILVLLRIVISPVANPEVTGSNVRVKEDPSPGLMRCPGDSPITLKPDAAVCRYTSTMSRGALPTFINVRVRVLA